jgi:Tol biopolymer transport system component
MRVPVDGGAPQHVADVDGRDGTWNADGTILIGSVETGPLKRVSADGGQPVPLDGTITGIGQSALAPQFLPDGKHFIYQREDLGHGKLGIWLGELGSPDSTPILDTFFNAQVAAGRLVYVKDDMLMAQRFDVGKRALTGEPIRVAGPVLRSNYPFHGFFSVAPAGQRLVYLQGTQAAGLAEVVWVDRSGVELSRPGIHGDLYNPQLSPDGRRLAIDISTHETHGDIWVFDLARGSSTRLTRDPKDESLPQWTPDGSRIVFFRVPDLYEIDAVGGAEGRRIYSDDSENFATDVSRDGRFVLFSSQKDGPSKIRVLDRETGEARDWLATEAVEDEARFSPDGRWIAYVSAESGRTEVYIDRFPDRGERFRVSTDGGSWPRWRADGKELFWVSDTNHMMAVTLDMDSDRNPIGTPQQLFSTRLRRSYFEPTADGERFLLLQRIEPEIDSITLIQNWSEGLRE